MWNFYDSKKFILIHHFNIEKIYTWGTEYKRKREEIRSYAIEKFPDKLHECDWYAFYIEVERSSKRLIDIENVPKLIIDAFSIEQIDKDKSRYPKLGLYPNDSLKHVRAFQIQGKPIDNEKDNTKVWIFGKKIVK